MEAKAENGKRIPLPLPIWPFILNVKIVIVVQFFVKYAIKSECFSDCHLQRNIFKGLWLTTNLKMNHVANQLIFKVISGQNFFILVLKFDDFPKNIFKQSFAHFLKIWGHTRIAQNSIHQHKQCFQSQHFNFFLCDSIFLKGKQRRPS